MTDTRDVTVGTIEHIKDLASFWSDYTGLSGLSVAEKDARIWEFVTSDAAPTVSPEHLVVDDIENLHQQVEALNLTSPAVRVAVHALIDAKRVASLTCQKPNCMLPGVPFYNGGRRNPAGLSIDHIILQCDGGGDRPNNIRLVHYVCNCSWSAGRKQTPETIEKSRLARDGWKPTAEQRQRMSRAHAGRTLTDAHRQAIADALATARRDQEERACPECERVFRGRQALGVHRSKTHGIKRNGSKSRG